MWQVRYIQIKELVYRHFMGTNLREQNVLGYFIVMVLFCFKLPNPGGSAVPMVIGGPSRKSG